MMSSPEGGTGKAETKRMKGRSNMQRSAGRKNGFRTAKYFLQEKFL
jgi:hypothetical protein